MISIILPLVAADFVLDLRSGKSTYEVTVETSYAKDGLPVSTLVQMALVSGRNRYLRISFGKQTLIANQDTESGDAKISLEQGREILCAKKVWPLHKPDTTRKKRIVDKNIIREISGMRCFNVREDFGDVVASTWMSVLDPTDQVAEFDYQQGHLLMSVVQVQKRLGTEKDFALFTFPSHGKYVNVTRQVFQDLNRKFIIIPEQF